MGLGYRMESLTQGYCDDQSHATKAFPVSPVPIGKAQVVYVRQGRFELYEGRG